ncbi:hypothetical protein C2S51_032262 [Perilla frutescens var. frutescens]|nr:hypothetical protein C2S51_032262 [Perilla frutescens var. frutescens]
MKESTPENNALHSLQEEEREVEEEEPHRLSFGDLPTTHSPTTTPSARPNLLFEFSGASPHPAATHSYYNDIVFCGKIIHDDDEEGGDQDEELNEYQKRDYFATVKSKSLRKHSSPDHDFDHRCLSASTRHSGELVRPKCDLDYHAQRVNISSLTSMSAKSKRRMFMFGPVKFKPEMELSAIKQRQAKLPAAEKTSPSPSPSGGGKGQWGMLKSSFRGRSHLTSVLARSLGCIPVAGRGGGVELRLGAAN